MYNQSSKIFRQDQNFARGYLPLPLGYLQVWNHEIFKHLLRNHFTNFHQISHGAFCVRGVDNFLTIEEDGCYAHIW